MTAGSLRRQYRPVSRPMWDKYRQFVDDMTEFLYGRGNPHGNDNTLTLFMIYVSNHCGTRIADLKTIASCVEWIGAEKQY